VVLPAEAQVLELNLETIAAGFRQVMEELDAKPLSLSEDGAVELVFSPFEIKTLRFS
jgi:hypothetical protein